MSRVADGGGAVRDVAGYHSARPHDRLVANPRAAEDDRAGADPRPGADPHFLTSRLGRSARWLRERRVRDHNLMRYERVVTNRHAPVGADDRAYEGAEASDLNLGIGPELKVGAVVDA
jgi:hypothetical protein